MLTSVFVVFLLLASGTESACKSNPSASNEEDTALTAHNVYRALHEDTAALCYGESGSSVTYTAQAWSEQQVKDATMKHSSGSYGENLYWTSDGSQTKETAYKTAIKLWYEEIKDWDFSTSAKKTSSAANAMVGHFTQVIWKDSQEVRCGFAQSASAGSYVTCQYYKPGNYRTQYAANVKPLSSSVIKTCNAPTVPNASVYPNRAINAGGSFIATCKSGYKITSGDSTMICSSSGTLPANPTCSKIVVQTCSAPAVANGTVSPINAIQVGEKFTVSCNEGFKIKGETTLTCGETVNAPSCVSSGAFVVKGSFVMVGLTILFGLVSSLL